MEKSDDIVMRKINIVKWESPVVAQYKIEGIPLFRLYDKEGKLQAEGSRLHSFLVAWHKKTDKEKAALK